MATIEVIENPRKRRKRRTTRRKMTAKQRKYFGRRRRRNPVVATLSNPRRRRSRRKVARYRRRPRRRNPAFSLGGMIDIQAAAGVTAGFMLARISPNLVSKVWAGAPTTGPVSYVIRIGSTIVAAMAVKTVTKKRELAMSIATGGIAYVLYDLANAYILPKLGLSGMSGYISSQRAPQIAGYGVRGYIPDKGVSGIPVNRMSGYLTSPLDNALAA
jgi:hypothetical protein